MTSELTVAETYIFSITLYIITILALIGAIHLIYNICKCKRKCHKCFKCINKWNHRNNIGINNRSVLTRSRSNNKHNNNTDNNKDTNIKDKQQHRRDRDRDIDMDISDSDSALNESFISKLCKIVCVLTVINFLIFLFFGCYQQSMYNHNQKSNNNSINFPIFSYHIISQCRILFCMIGFYIYGKMLLYIYFVIRAYNMLEGSELNYNKTTVVCILSIYFIMMNFILFSMIYVHLTDDYCININNNTTIHKKRSIVFGIGATVDGSMAILSVSLLIHKLFALVRQSMLVHGWLDKITPHPSPQHTPRQSILSTTNTNTIIKPKTYEIKLTKQIEMSTSNALNNNNNNNNKKIATFRRCSRTDDSDNDNDNDSTPNNNIVRNDIFPGSLPSSTRQSLQSYNNTNNIIINNRLDNRRISASITPSILIENDVFTINPNELQSIYSNEQLIDDDESITKIKKLNINKIKQIDMIEEANNNGFDMIEEEEEDDDENNKILLTLEDNIHDDDDDDDQSEEEEEEEKSPLQGTICNISNNNSNENKLQIPQVTPYNSNNSNISVISDRSPRNSILSLSRRSSSIFEMMQMKLNKASAIVSEISHEHIKRFHNVTQYDNEILLLSTKLLILLTICVISSFCSFLLLFGIIRTNANNGIFFVYGIDSFINIWCLNFTFKFSNKCYNILFNCGKKNQCTKCCFPMVKTAALTWKFCCCYKRKYKLNIRQKSNIKKPPKMPKNGHHMVAQNSVTYNYQLSNNNNKDDNIEFEDIEINNNNQHSNEHSNNNDESQCHMNCCFCCWGNKQDIHIYHLARGEVELMLTQNSKLYK